MRGKAGLMSVLRSVGESTSDFRSKKIGGKPSVGMNAKTARQFDQEDISYLAYVSWEKDGCPPDRSLDYWLEVEKQLDATWKLLVKDISGKKKSSKKNQGLKLAIRQMKVAGVKLHKKLHLPGRRDAGF